MDAERMRVESEVSKDLRKYETDMTIKGMSKDIAPKRMRKVFIRVKPDDVFPNNWMITVQTEGYPETVGFLDDKLQGMSGSKAQMFRLAELLRVEEQKANPNMKVVVMKR